jgi:hypothetical protein
MALQRGLSRYFTGKRCRRGHVAERYSNNGECVICAKLRANEWKKTPKGRIYQRQYHQTPKMREHMRRYDRERHAKRRERKREFAQPPQSK